MRTELRGMFMLVTVIIFVIFGAQTIAEREGPAACARTLPVNIDLPCDLERMLARIYRSSATFRTQCDRIGDAGTLSVSVRLDTGIPRSCQAFTIFSRRGRLLHADVHLPPSGTLMAQPVGHGFEHVVEQLEGLDLRSLARIRGSGVHESSLNMYESVRAQHAGLLVAGEASTRRAAD